MSLPNLDLVVIAHSAWLGREGKWWFDGVNVRLNYRVQLICMIILCVVVKEETNYSYDI